MTENWHQIRRLPRRHPRCRCGKMAVLVKHRKPHGADFAKCQDWNNLIGKCISCAGESRRETVHTKLVFAKN